MTDNDWNRPHPNRPAVLPRPPKPGEEVWRLRDNETGRVQWCELRDNSQAGASWEVQILEAGEILVSRRCENEREARYVAEAARKDSLRTGSTAVGSDGG
jgi:predicted secreted protein